MQQNITSICKCNTESGFYDYQWLSKFLGVSVSVCRQWVSQGRIPYHKLAGGSLVRFRREDILRWIEDSKVEAE